MIFTLESFTMLFLLLHEELKLLMAQQASGAAARTLLACLNVEKTLRIFMLFLTTARHTSTMFFVRLGMFEGSQGCV
jgi:hypothetical protein